MHVYCDNCHKINPFFPFLKHISYSFEVVCGGLFICSPIIGILIATVSLPVTYSSVADCLMTRNDEAAQCRRGIHSTLRSVHEVKLRRFRTIYFNSIQRGNVVKKDISLQYRFFLLVWFSPLMEVSVNFPHGI